MIATDVARLLRDRVLAPVVLAREGLEEGDQPFARAVLENIEVEVEAALIELERVA